MGVGQMGGQGNFSDPRIGLFITQAPDLVTPKLAALLDYQLSLRTPPPPEKQLRSRGGQTRRASLPQRSGMRHVPPAAEFHRRAERSDAGGAIPARSGRGRHGSGYAARTATMKYRTTPLRGLWQHAPYFHDGSAPDLLSVVNHYNRQFTAESHADDRKRILSNS